MNRQRRKTRLLTVRTSLSNFICIESMASKILETKVGDRTTVAGNLVALPFWRGRDTEFSITFRVLTNVGHS